MNSRRLLWLLLIVVGSPTVALVWLGIRLLEQDRALVARRDVERRQVDAQATVHTLEEFLGNLERNLNEGQLPNGAVRFAFSRESVKADPADALLWLPLPSPLPEAETRAFADGERLEFRGEFQAARNAYLQFADATDHRVRAGALLRLARIARAQKQWEEARRAYDALAQIPDVAIEGMPADLVARRAAAAVLEESQQRAELSREAAALANDFTRGKWLLDRASWELTSSDLERWTGRSTAVSDDKQSLSLAADTLWNQWRDRRPFSSRRWLIEDGNTPLTVLVGADGAHVLVLTPALLDDVLKNASSRSSFAGVIALVTPEGGHIVGPASSKEPVLVPAAESHLPWTIAVSTDPVWQATELAGRRRLLLLGLGAILVLFAGGSFFLWRVVRQELEVARLQTEFVAAVSHEFRTPLTSLSHVTELLQESDDVPLARRHSFYDALGRNTERLQRLVESLLDFARMESGRKPYRLTPTNVTALVTAVIADFRHDATGHGFDVEFSAPLPAANAMVDEPSLRNALWNLLDNAVKYSPDRHAITVNVSAHADEVRIAVSDEGIGVPARERAQIFQRFIRGRMASELGIKGTGLGLAMVDHIVKAHGGRVELESKEGTGSTFTIVLPLTASAALAPAATVLAEGRSLSLEP